MDELVIMDTSQWTRSCSRHSRLQKNPPAATRQDVSHIVRVSAGMDHAVQRIVADILKILAMQYVYDSMVHILNDQ